MVQCIYIILEYSYISPFVKKNFFCNFLYFHFYGNIFVMRIDALVCTLPFFFFFYPFFLRMYIVMRLRNFGRDSSRVHVHAA